MALTSEAVMDLEQAVSFVIEVLHEAAGELTNAADSIENELAYLDIDGLQGLIDRIEDEVQTAFDNVASLSYDAGSEVITAVEVIEAYKEELEEAEEEAEEEALDI